jgi:hypothetical protein
MSAGGERHSGDCVHRQVKDLCPECKLEYARGLLREVMDATYRFVDANYAFSQVVCDGASPPVREVVWLNLTTCARRLGRLEALVTDFLGDAPWRSA